MIISPIATISILLLLALFSQFCVLALEYKPELDQKPDSSWHRLIRRFSNWMADDNKCDNG